MAKLVRISDQTCVVGDLKFADTYFTRLRGLIGVKNFKFGDGLLFPRCNSIHMWMMSIPIDIVFLQSHGKKAQKEWTVLCVREQVKPWRLFPLANSRADDVLELPAGLVKSISLKKGEVLCIAL